MATVHISVDEGLKGDEILRNISEIITNAGYYCFGEIAITEDVYLKCRRIDFRQSRANHIGKLAKE